MKISSGICICFLMLGFVGGTRAVSQKDLTLQALRVQQPIKVDGQLWENCWEQAIPVSAFTQREPVEGAEPTEKTELRIVFDDHAIYIGARLYDHAPDSIVARPCRRDATFDSDMFLFGIDSYYDRRSGYYFGINAAGSFFDGILYNDDWADDSWDGVWEGAARIDSLGWTAELRIPFSQLRFKKKDQYVWAVNAERMIQRKNEDDFIVYTPRNESGFVSRFADLQGVKGIDASRGIEFLPYVRAKAEFLQVDPEDPFNDRSHFFPAAGADFKVGIGNNLTLDGTVNPDFGQVEVDPAVINLSDVETFYQEKRPFFIEGANIFNFGIGGSNNNININFWNPDFFYSRRIGASPRGCLPDYDYADIPEGTRIISAAKLSGKMAGSWNVGVLNALTAREFARLDYEGEQFDQEAEPLSNYTILRLQKEFTTGKQGLGLIATGTQRFFQDKQLRNDFNQSAHVLGIDGWTFFGQEKAWVLSGWMGFSTVQGSLQRMIDLQESSRHYFQRPDANHVSVDSQATSLSGFATRLTLNKQRGNVIFNTALGVINPSFDINDVGFMERADVINFHIVTGYHWTEPNCFRRRSQLGVMLVQNYDFGGNSNALYIGAFGNILLSSYWFFEFTNVYIVEGWDNTATRGGPLMQQLPGLWGDFSIQSDSRKKLYLECSGEYWFGTSGSREKTFSLELVWKPASNIMLEIEPELQSSQTDAQWVDCFDDATATRTFGKRYVFAELEHTTFATNLRLNWTFTPKLTLQLYAQPLVSLGDYQNFKELKRPKTYDFLVYGEEGSTFDSESGLADPDGLSGPAPAFEIENPDFNIQSLRFSTVLRWEFLPGSSLYLVWTQGGFEELESVDMSIWRSAEHLSKLQSDNILMLKVSYWLNI